MKNNRVVRIALAIALLFGTTIQPIHACVTMSIPDTNYALTKMCDKVEDEQHRVYYVNADQLTMRMMYDDVTLQIGARTEARRKQLDTEYQYFADEAINSGETLRWQHDLHEWSNQRVRNIWVANFKPN